jgi:sulfur carrier protein ThiS
MTPSTRRRRWTFVVITALAGCGVREIDLVPQGGSPAPGTGGTGTPSVLPPAGGAGGSGGAPARPDASASAGSGGPKLDAAPSGGGTGGGATDGPPGPSPEPPPPSGVTVSINGMPVPREKAIVILHLGHSNMAGRAMDPASLMPLFYNPDPHLWQYKKGGVWTAAREPLAGDGGTPGIVPSNQGAGPGMALLHNALALAPDAYIISIGQGESLDYDASCFTFRKGGLFYNKVAGPALELKGKVTFAGLFVMLGYDARTAARAQNGGFLTCLEGLAADFRSDLGEPNLPFIQNDYERGATGSFSPSCCGAPGVIAQLAQVTMSIPGSILVPTDGIAMQDNHHFNMAGHKEWADRAFKAMAAARMLPWAR